MCAGPPLRCERISLSDQAGELGQGIIFRPPMLIATATIVIGRKRSVLISFGHRDDASLGKAARPSTKARLSTHKAVNQV
jgi:hypothetical protein